MPPENYFEGGTKSARGASFSHVGAGATIAPSVKRCGGESCKSAESQLCFVLVVAGAVAGWRDYVDAHEGPRSSLEQLEVKD